MQIVQVFFRGNVCKTYDYFTDLDLKVGEPVIVQTGSTFSVGTVQGFVSESKNAKVWIVQKIDVAGHEERKAMRELLE